MSTTIYRDVDAQEVTDSLEDGTHYVAFAGIEE